MTDLPGGAPGSNICGAMKHIGVGEGSRAEICTYQPHDEYIPHFMEDADAYFKRIMDWYDTQRDELGQLSDELREQHGKFIFKFGINLQRLVDDTKAKYERDPPDLGTPPRTAPDDGRPYPRPRIVRDEDVLKELGICGATKVTDGELYICTDVPNHPGIHNWMAYEVAVETADQNFGLLSRFARELGKGLLGVVSGERPEDLPPFGEPIDHTPPPIVDPDEDTVEIPPLNWPDMPSIASEIDEDDDMSDDPIPPRPPPGSPGRPSGARGPGDPKWDEAVKSGAKWSENALRPPAQPDPLPGAEPDLPDGVSGEPIGSGGGRRQPNYCRATMRHKGKIYICWKDFGHLRLEEPHRWTYWKDEGE